MITIIIIFNNYIKVQGFFCFNEKKKRTIYCKDRNFVLKFIK